LIHYKSLATDFASYPLLAFLSVTLVAWVWLQVCKNGLSNVPYFQLNNHCRHPSCHWFNIFKISSAARVKLGKNQWEHISPRWL